MSEELPIYEVDSFPRPLKEPLDLAKLRDPESKGCVFEVDADDLNHDDAFKEDTSNAHFDREEVFHNSFKAELLGEEDDEDDTDDESPFERKAKKMTDISPDKDGGVTKRVLQMGAGKVAPRNSLVFVHYNAFVEYGDEPYDSTYLRKSVKRFRLGNNEVIPGLDIAVATMKKKERASVIIKPEYGLGEMGAPPRVPKNAWLLFEVELVDFVEKGEIQDYLAMTEEERRELSFDQVLTMVKGEKEEGTKLFNIGQHCKALQKYDQASTILEKHPLQNEEQQSVVRGHLLKLYLNLALCSLKMSYSKRTLYYCTKALQLDDGNVKALYRRGLAYHQLGQFDLAKKTLLQACRIDPMNRDIRRELERVNKSVAEEKVASAKLYRQMLQLDKLGINDDDKNKNAAKKEDGKEEEEGEEVSEQFRQSLREWLTKFKEDSSAKEMEQPGVLSVPEIAALMDEVIKLGLNVHMRGSGQSKHLVVTKEKEEK